MAKENCALCGKLVGGLYKMTLGDGNTICTECWSRGKMRIGVKPKDFTIDSFREHIETDTRVQAAKVKQERKEEIREIKASAAQEKNAQRDWNALEKLGLNFDRYDDAELRAQNMRDVQQLAATITGSRFSSIGSLLQGKAVESMMIEINRAQIDQNLILIRQNEEIIRLLRQIVDGK